VEKDQGGDDKDEVEMIKRRTVVEMIRTIWIKVQTRETEKLAEEVG
jgi:hypothetical protein